MDIINRLTEKIDNYGTENSEWGTSTDVHAMLWQDINDLRNMTSDNKANAMREWRYKDDFECTEIEHVNGRKMFYLMNWEHSFALTLLFMHYH